MWAFLSWLHWWDGEGAAVDPTPRRFRATIGPAFAFRATIAAPVRFNPTFTP